MPTIATARPEQLGLAPVLVGTSATSSASLRLALPSQESPASASDWLATSVEQSGQVPDSILFPSCHRQRGLSGLPRLE